MDDKERFFDAFKKYFENRSNFDILCASLPTFQTGRYHCQLN